jgi:hypothetical protein
MKRYSEAMEMESPQASEAFERRVSAALERQPAVLVPEGFAECVSAALPAHRHRRSRLRAGRAATGVAVLAGLAAVLWLAPHSAPSWTNLPFDAELLLMTEVTGIVAWFALKGREV